MRHSVVLLALLTLAPSVAAQEPGARRCQLVIDSVGGEMLRQELNQVNVNWFGGGGVAMHCRNQEVFLQSDSAISINGQVVQFIGRAQYRDSDVTLDADTLVYYAQPTEWLQALGNVRIVSSEDGAVLVAPRVDHYRPGPGRDSAETIAGILGRATATLPVRQAAGDTTSPGPYVVDAGTIRRRGGTTLAWDSVTITRDSLTGRGDTLVYLRGDLERATLTGRPAHMSRRGADAFTVTGNVIVLGLEGEELTSLDASGAARVIGEVGDIRGESVRLVFVEGALTGTEAWVAAPGRGEDARILAQGYDIRGDSIAVDTPGERLRELRVFGRGRMVEPLDSTTPAPDPTVVDSLPPIQNTITGRHLVASFEDVDSAGTLLTRIRRIFATGEATALFARDVIRDGQPSPTINYTRADTILVEMREGDTTGVAVVRAYRGGRPVDGVQLERATLRQAATADSAAARRPEGGSTP